MNFKNKITGKIIGEADYFSLDCVDQSYYVKDKQSGSLENIIFPRRSAVVSTNTEVPPPPEPVSTPPQEDPVPVYVGSSDPISINHIQWSSFTTGYSENPTKKSETNKYPDAETKYKGIYEQLYSASNKYYYNPSPKPEPFDEQAKTNE